jgi:hypothetical protein
MIKYFKIMSIIFSELQKATGLRVLRRVVERQQSLERDDENFLRQLRQTGVNTINKCLCQSILVIPALSNPLATRNMWQIAVKMWHTFPVFFFVLL